MKKLNIVLLLLLFAGMQSLVAQAKGDGTVTVKVNPSVNGKGRLNIAGADERSRNTPVTDGAEGKIKVEADYEGIVGASVEMKTTFNEGTPVNLGDAYAYAHVLQAFGVDPKVFDVYLKSGRFGVGFTNAQDAGWDIGKKHVGDLGSGNYTNMQIDLKILDMLTFRYGMRFSRFEGLATDGLAKDIGSSVQFEKSFGAHNIKASIAYVYDTTNNDGETYNGTSLANVTMPTDKDPKHADDLSFSLAYTGTFGSFKLMPYFNLRIQDLLAKEYYTFESPTIGWDTGLKFQLRDADDSYDMVGAGVGFDGETRENSDYLNMDGETGEMDYMLNQGFKGFYLKVWSDGLRAIMGKNYLSAWARVRFETWVPDIENLTRESVLAQFGFGLTQYLVNTDHASVKLNSELNVENTAPFYVEDSGYRNTSDFGLTDRSDDPFKVTLDLGLEASFNASIKASMK